MKANSKEYPTIQRLQGKILVPTNITQITNEDEEESYNYWQVDFPLNSRYTDEELVHLANKEYAKIQQTESLEAGCITSLGFRIDCLPNNVVDFSQTLALISIYPAMTEIVVRDYDNINHTITVEQYQQMCAELGAHVMGVRQSYWSDVDRDY